MTAMGRLLPSRGAGGGPAARSTTAREGGGVVARPGSSLKGENPVVRERTINGRRPAVRRFSSAAELFRQPQPCKSLSAINCVRPTSLNRRLLKVYCTVLLLARKNAAYRSRRSHHRRCGVGDFGFNRRSTKRDGDRSQSGFRARRAQFNLLSDADKPSGSQVKISSAPPTTSSEEF